MHAPALLPPRFVRLTETGRPTIELCIDGITTTALEGDTLLVALLSHGRRLRDSEFGDGVRAGFCLMGACQDCWVWDATGRRLCACVTVARDGMSIVTQAPPATWPQQP